VFGGETFIPFGQDSAYCDLSNSSGRKIIYTMAIPDNGIHYKIYDTIGNLREIAYARRIPLAFDSVDYYGTVMYPYPDSIVQYYNNGVIQATGFVEYEAEDYQYASNSHWTIKYEYDSTGILINKITATEPDGIDWRFISTSYYRNGNIKEKYIQGSHGSGGACLGITKWDSLGYKTKEYQYDYKFPEWGESQYDRFCVETIIEYYPNGKVKQITKTKSFYESDECPCGQWVYYDEKEQKIRTEQHKPCNNFLIECKSEF